MAQKINPIALRLQNTNHYFNNCWYNDFFYQDLISQDLKIQKYLHSIFKQVQYPTSKLFIQYSQKEINIFAYFFNPTESRKSVSRFFKIKHYISRKKRLAKKNRKIKKRLTPGTKSSTRVDGTQSSTKVDRLVTLGNRFEKGFVKRFIQRCLKVSTRKNRKIKKIFTPRTKSSIRVDGFEKGFIQKSLSAKTNRKIKQRLTPGTKSLTLVDGFAKEIIQKSLSVRTNRKIKQRFTLTFAKELIQEYLMVGYNNEQEHLIKSLYKLKFNNLKFFQIKAKIIAADKKRRFGIVEKVIHLINNISLNIIDTFKFRFVELKRIKARFQRNLYIESIKKEIKKYISKELIMYQKLYFKNSDSDDYLDFENLFLNFWFMRYFKKRIENILTKQVSKKVNIIFQKCINEFTYASFLAEEIVYYLKKRVPFYKIRIKILEKVAFLPEIKGIRVTCSGRIGGRSKKALRAKTQTFYYGATPLHVFSSYIDFSSKAALTSFGLTGIKVWVCRFNPVVLHP